MAHAEHTEGGGAPSLTTLLIACAVIAGLYFGRDLLIPFALAALLTFIPAPLVGW
jgi:predicted PurR-regulated permease PerM